MTIHPCTKFFLQNSRPPMSILWNLRVYFGIIDLEYFIFLYFSWDGGLWYLLTWFRSPTKWRIPYGNWYRILIAQYNQYFHDIFFLFSNLIIEVNINYYTYLCIVGSQVWSAPSWMKGLANYFNTYRVEIIRHHGSYYK